MKLLKYFLPVYKIFNSFAALVNLKEIYYICNYLSNIFFVLFLINIILPTLKKTFYIEIFVILLIRLKKETQ